MRNKLNVVGTGLAVAAVVMVAGSNAGAAIISPAIDFDVASDYDNNFVETLAAANIGYSASGQNIRYAPLGNNGTAIIRYDTNVSDGQPGPSDFLTETLSSTVTFSTLAADGSGSTPSVGYFTRIQSDGSGILALFNPAGTTAGTGARLRMWYGSTTAAIGTNFYDVTTTGLSNTYSANAPLTLKLDQTSGAAPTFTLSILDAEGLIASSGAQTLPVGGRPTYANAGSIGMRFNLPTAASNFITVDNFGATTAVVPEPATAVVALGALSLMTLRRRVG